MNTPSNSEPSQGLWSRPLLILCTAAFLAAMFLYTRHNDFSYRFHPDEPTKVNQIINGTNNFNHPGLMLNATRLTYLLVADHSITEHRPQRQQAVVIGRWVSAFFGAGAVVLLMIVAHLRFGLLGATCAAAIIMLSHALLLFSHYLKEDTALMFGLSATFLALAIYHRKPSPTTAIWLGVACGLAVSGKYLGVVAVFMGFMAVISEYLRCSITQSMYRAMKPFAMGLLITCAVINLPIFLHPIGFFRGFGRETLHAVTAHHGTQQTSITYFASLVSMSSIGVRVFAGGYMLNALATWRERAPEEKWLIAFSLVYFSILAVSPIQASRYLLPIIVAIHLMAAFGILEASRFFIRRFNSQAAGFVFVAVSLIVTVTLQLPADARMLRDFDQDSRALLTEWIDANVPVDARIAQDFLVGLPLDVRGLKGKQFDRLNSYGTSKPPYVRFIGDLGDLRTARELGLTHIAVCEGYYKAYISENVVPLDDKQSETLFRRRKHFYTELFERGHLLWTNPTESTGIGHANPNVRFYRLPND